MANVLHRTTKKFLTSVNTPEFPIIDWIINPNISAVSGFETKYWIITGDVVTLMDLAARNALDVVIEDARRDAIADGIERLVSYHRAFAIIVKDEINILRSQHALANRTLAQLKTALRNNL